MNNLKYSKLLLLLGLLILFFNTYGQTNINGTVIDGNGATLIGVNVIIENTDEGTITDSNGKFSLTTNLSPPFNIRVSFVGLVPSIIPISQSTSDLNIQLQEGIRLSDFIVSASRKSEKILSAPASVSVLSEAELRVNSDQHPTRNLGNLPGVFVSQQSGNAVNIEMRGSGDVLTTDVFPIMDYRTLITPGADVFFANQVGISSIDVFRVEVVRGPGSALYGPGVTTGIVHYLTKNPISYPGTTIELTGGEMNTYGASIRHATKVSDKFGFKINAHYSRGDEFNYDLSNEEDAIFVSGLATRAVRSQIVNGVQSLSADPTILIDNLDDDGDGNPVQDFYSYATINGSLEFRPEEETSIFINGGWNTGNQFFFATNGIGLQQASEYWGQVRIQKKGLFAQLYYNSNDGGSDEKPSFAYETGASLPLKRKYLDGQLQYNFKLPSLKADVTVGGDYREVFSNSGQLVYGRNEDFDKYNIFGGYFQSKFELTKKLNLVVAARVDKAEVINETLFSPRVALVYKADSKNTFRLTYNKSVGAPAALENFADIPLAEIVPGLMTLWLNGSANTANFEGSTLDLTLPGLPDIPLESQGLPTSTALAIVNGALLQAGVTVSSELLTGNPSGTIGQFIGLDIISGGVPLSPQNQEPLGAVTTEAYEIGYSGVMANDNLKVSLDVYFNKQKGFIRSGQVAPVYALILDKESFVLAVSTAAEAIEPGQGALYETTASAVYDGISPLFPVFGVARSEANPVDGDVAFIHFAYRYIPDQIEYFGVDLGLDYSITSDFSAFFNYTIFNKNEFELASLDAGSTFKLNQPKNRFRTGVKLIPESGFSGSLVYSYTPSFAFDGAFFSGNTDVRNVIDINAGYVFDNGLHISVGVTNLFDSNYRNAPNMPMLGRRAVSRLQYSF